MAEKTVRQERKQPPKLIKYLQIEARPNTNHFRLFKGRKILKVSEGHREIERDWMSWIYKISLQLPDKCLWDIMRCNVCVKAPQSCKALYKVNLLGEYPSNTGRKGTANYLMYSFLQFSPLSPSKCGWCQQAVYILYVCILNFSYPVRTPFQYDHRSTSTPQAHNPTTLQKLLLQSLVHFKTQSNVVCVSSSSLQV